MSSLADKLKSMGVKVGAQDLKPVTHRRTIDQVIPGHIQQSPFGETYLVQSRHSIGELHGTISLQFPKSLQFLCEWAGLQTLEGVKQDHLVFLDTETSGLVGGAGTFAFMVGVGRFDEGGFELNQFFLRDPSEEPAMLAALEAYLSPQDILVTFNGKAFDVPLLSSRFITNGWDEVLLPDGHIDLLHLARRLWRDRLSSRTLSDLETHILGLIRAEDEVPGWLVPQLYVDYLRSGDAEPLMGVFYHNAMDILSLAALLNHTATMLADPLSIEADDGYELVAIGRLYEDVGHSNLAIELYQLGLQCRLPKELFRSTEKRLSLIHKRRGEYEAAIELWQSAIAGGEIYAFVELAKYYEHQIRDFEQAEDFTRTAIDLVKAPETPIFDQFQWLAELEHRHQRLIRKLGYS